MQRFETNQLYEHWIKNENMTMVRDYRKSTSFHIRGDLWIETETVLFVPFFRY